MTARSATGLFLSAWTTWLTVLALLAASAQTRAVPQPIAPPLQLLLQTPDHKTYTLGTVAAFFRRMRALGQTCHADPYDHGVDIDCAPAPERRLVLLDFVYEPGPNPETATLDALRIQGVNGGFVPAAQWLSIMTTLTGETPKPATP